MSKQVELEAVNYCPVDSSHYKVGERFSADEATADVLVGLNRAKRIKETAKNGDGSDGNPDKRTYNRRDLKAKG